MRMTIRRSVDSFFTLLAYLSAALMVLALVLILAPMFYRGAQAVVFKGTVEFRRMQLAEFGHGNEPEVEAEIEETQKFRSRVYGIVDRFKEGIEVEDLCSRARKIHRDFGDQLRRQDAPQEQYRRLRDISRDIRDNLDEAFRSVDEKKANKKIEYVLQYKSGESLKDTPAQRFFALAEKYREILARVDLSKREKYERSFAEVQDLLTELLGPRPGAQPPAMPRLRYGATRWDKAESVLHQILWAEQWVQLKPDEPMVKKEVSRAKQFEGTALEPLFGLLEKHTDKMLNPQWTFYWRYFIDDNINSHYFGGVGPEILGTLLITILTMLFVIPFGIVSAAYLVECASDNFATRIIRMGINTLAGVPSIVFGLFGLAFFVLFLIPLFGGPSAPCILAGALTLAVLALPVMIRAGEEAIRSVPQHYKEASLALGASRFRAFMTVTLPAASPGILTAIILSLGRVAGETAPILFTVAVAVGPVPDSIFDQTRTLSYGSYDVAMGDRMAMMVPHQQYGMVATLIVLVLLLNGVSIYLRGRVFKKLTGR